jgi:hypothetical protein
VHHFFALEVGDWNSGLEARLKERGNDACGSSNVFVDIIHGLRKRDPLTTISKSGRLFIDEERLNE